MARYLKIKAIGEGGFRFDIVECKSRGMDQVPSNLINKQNESIN